MKSQDIINQLESNSDVYKDLLKGIPVEMIKWKPSENKWSMLEIVCHLYDEEREDFRARLAKILLEDHNWDPIDPQGWVVSRDYMNRNYDSVLKDFLNERNLSVEWLKSLQVHDWNIKAVHPSLGEFSAIHMLSEWYAHDLLHMRQIIKLKFDFLNNVLKPYSISYAGNF
ncbi:MAG: DinB family protein [Bacteroidetes bacterium]|nr:DinB family protein [Bacteroidota bacterium]